ncbi:MAG: DMT family transporter [Acidimicrobiia bacterium]
MSVHRKGLLLALGTALISGFAVFVNGYGVRAWSQFSDPTTYTTLKNLVAAVILIGALGAASRSPSTFRPVAPTGRVTRLGLGAVAVVGGSVAFVLFFEGLALASSVQAAFIHKTLVIWVAILAVALLRERIGLPHMAAIGLLLIGQVALVGGIGDLAFGRGELMILVATLLWAAEVVLAKRLLADVSSFTVGVARMAGGVALLVAYGLARGAFAELSGVTIEHVAWVLVTGVFLAGYVGTWFAALARAPAVDVTAVLVGGAIITALLRTAAGGALPSLAGIGLLVAGISVLIRSKWRRAPQPA